MRQGKLGRTAAARRALFRSVVTSLFLYNRITTTEAKAKAVRPIAERLITWARKGDLHHRRLAASFILEPRAVQNLFDTIGPHFADRPGGYTRIIKLGFRSGDAAPVAMLELIGMEPLGKPEDEKKPVKKAAKKSAVKPVRPRRKAAAE